MSKKHFKRLAETIRAALQSTAPENRAPVEELAVEIANLCAEMNERFDRNRFYAACGLGYDGKANQ